MTPHQRFQRNPVPAHEALQQLAVAVFLEFLAQSRSAKGVDKFSDGIGRHVPYSGGGLHVSSTLVITGSRRFYP
jgi:hypothetical protein